MREKGKKRLRECPREGAHVGARSGNEEAWRRNSVDVWRRCYVAAPPSAWRRPGNSASTCASMVFAGVVSIDIRMLAKTRRKRKRQ